MVPEGQQAEIQRCQSLCSAAAGKAIAAMLKSQDLQREGVVVAKASFHEWRHLAVQLHLERLHGNVMFLNHCKTMIFPKLQN